MKKIIISILSLIFLVLIAGCSRSTEPQIRITNKQAGKVDVKIQASGKIEFNISDVEPGQTTDYQAISEGNVSATAIVQNQSISFLAAKSTRYTIVISTDAPPSLRIDK